MPLQSVYYELSDPGLKPLSGLTEIYIPLWVYSAGNVNTLAGSANPVAGTYFVQKGTTSVGNSSSSSRKFHTLSASWNPSQKFAFEASIWNGYNSILTFYAALWDLTSNALVSASQLNGTATTAAVLRSGQFTLAPGHSYAVTMWSSGGAYCYLSKAHLIALL